MRVPLPIRIAAILSILPLHAAGPAVGRGSPPSGSKPSPLPRPPNSRGGRGSVLGGVRPIPWNFAPSYPGFGSPGCSSLPYPAELYSLFASAFCNPLAYPPPINAPQPINLILPPAPYVAPSAPPFVSAAPAAERAGSQVLSPPETFHFSQTPVSSPVVLKEYPAIVTFRPGGIYSVTKYWRRNRRFYFVTPQGETLYVPSDLVERIYPAIRSSPGAP